MPVEQVLNRQRFQVVCDYCGQCGPRAEYRDAAGNLAKSEGFKCQRYYKEFLSGPTALVSCWACPKQDCQEKFEAWKEEQDA